MYRRYLIIISSIFAMCLPFLGTSYIYLYRSGELNDMEAMAALQISARDFCIVGPALHEDRYHYKLALYQAYKPDVIVLGSSRMLQYRSHFFRGNFLNMGSTVRDIGTGEHVLSAMLASHKPRLILLGIDYWWFNDRIESPGKVAKPVPKKYELGISDLLEPYLWIYQGKLSVKTFTSRILRAKTSSQPCRLGVSALENNAGFGPDGSFYYGSTVSGEKDQIYDQGFQDTLREMTEDNSRFRHGTTINSESLSLFLEFIDKINAAGIDVIIILPPHAPSIAKAMASMQDAYAYIDDLRHKLRESGIHYYDFHDGNMLGTNDCEFYDGSHPGDITNARVLRSLINTKGSKLKEFLNMHAIDSAISNHAGYAMLPEPRALNRQETDFLKLGCNK